MIDRTKEYYDREYVTYGRSPKSIAEEWDTYPNKIRRELIKYGFKLRDKSEAQSVALKCGRHKHPTKGRERSDDAKIKISEKMAENWANMDPLEKQRRIDIGKQQWESMSEEDKSTFRYLALEAVRLAAQNGSKLENYLLNSLQNKGYEVSFHSEHILPNTRLQTDLFIPSHQTVIEIDGPSHFLPIWGQESLERNIEADNKKNSSLLAYGFVIIRVKHLAKNISEIHRRQLLSKLDSILKSIKSNFPALQDRLIEIELK